MWLWVQTSPGMIHLPVASNDLAPEGTVVVSLGPTARIVPPWTTIVPSLMTGPAAVTILAWVQAIGSEASGVAARAPPERRRERPRHGALAAALSQFRRFQRFKTKVPYGDRIEGSRRGFVSTERNHRRGEKQLDRSDSSPDQS